MYLAKMDIAVKEIVVNCREQAVSKQDTVINISIFGPR